MSRERRKNKTTKTIAVIVACLMLAAVGGTIAWMTAKDNLTNEFLVGDFTDPDTKPDDPDQEIPDGDKENGKLNGHLYEPSWVANSKLTPGAAIAKDPMVGIGDGSENAYVYLYVKNNAEVPSNIYFTLNDGWEAVDGYASKVTDLTPDDPAYESGKTYYSGGLFKCSDVLTGKKDADSWTNRAFSNVYVKNSATTETLVTEGSDGTSLVVTALLHQATSGDTTTDLESVADQWAKEQATELAQ